MAEDKDLNASEYRDVVSLSEQLVGNLREVAKIERHIQQSIGVSSQEYLFNIKKLEEIVRKEHELSQIIDVNKRIKEQIRSLETTEIKSIQTRVKEQEEYKSSVEEVLSQVRQELKDNKGLLKFAQEQVNEKAKEVKFAQNLVKNQEEEVNKAEKLLQNKSTITKETQNLISQKYIELQQAQELLKIQESELKQAQQTFSSFKEKVTEKQKEVSVGKELLKEAESEASKTKEVLKSEKEKIEQLREIKTINQSKIESLKEEKQTIKDNVFAGESQLKTYVDQKKEVQKIQETLNKQAGDIEKAKNLELSRKDINKVVNELTSKKAELESINQKVAERINEIKSNELNTLTEHSIKKEQELDKQREIVEQSKFNLEYALKSQSLSEDELNKLQQTKLEAEKKYSTLEKEVSKSHEVVEAKKQELFSLEQTQEVSKQIVENIEQQSSKLEQVSKHLTRNKNVLDASEKLFNKISKIPLVGQLFNAGKAMEHLKKKAQEGAVGIGDMFSAIGKGLQGLTYSTVILAIFQAMYQVIKFLAELMFEIDKRVTAIAKSFGVTKEEADKIYQGFVRVTSQVDELATISEGYLATTKAIMQTQLDFNEALGMTVKLSDENLAQLTFARDAIGLSVEETNELAKYTLVTGMNAQDIEKSMIGASLAVQSQSKVQMQLRPIMAQALKTTGAIRANFKGNVAEIAAAITKAKALGTTLEQMEKTSNSLLDFESSIEKELEAELLYGRELNLERARYFALTGKTVELMEELNNQGITFEEFTSKNIIAQQAMAEVFGMQRGEFADMLFEQKLIGEIQKKYGDISRDAAVKRFEELKEQGRLQSELGGLLDEELKKRLGVLDAQTKFNNALEAAKEAFMNLVAALGGREGLDKVVNLIVDLVKVLQDVVTSISTYGMYETFVGEGMTKVKSEREKKEYGGVAKQYESRIKEAETEGDQTKVAELKQKQTEYQQNFESNVKKIEELNAQIDEASPTWYTKMFEGEIFTNLRLERVKELQEEKQQLLSGGLPPKENKTEQAAQAGTTPQANTSQGTTSINYMSTPLVGHQSGGYVGDNIRSFDAGGFTGKGSPSAPAGIVHKGEYVVNARETNLFSSIVSNLGQAISVLSSIFTKQQEFTEKTDKILLNQQDVTEKTNKLVTNTITNQTVSSVTQSKTEAISPQQAMASLFNITNEEFTNRLANQKSASSISTSSTGISETTDSAFKVIGPAVKLMESIIPSISSLFTKTEKIETSTITPINQITETGTTINNSMSPLALTSNTTSPIGGIGDTKGSTSIELNKLVQSVEKLLEEMKRPKDITIENKVMLDYETLQVGFSKKAVNMNS